MRIASNLRFAIFSPPKRDSQKRGWYPETIRENHGDSRKCANRFVRIRPSKGHGKSLDNPGKGNMSTDVQKCPTFVQKMSKHSQKTRRKFWQLLDKLYLFGQWLICFPLQGREIRVPVPWGKIFHRYEWFCLFLQENNMDQGVEKNWEKRPPAGTGMKIRLLSFGIISAFRLLQQGTQRAGRGGLSLVDISAPSAPPPPQIPPIRRRHPPAPRPLPLLETPPPRNFNKKSPPRRLGLSVPPPRAEKNKKYPWLADSLGLGCLLLLALVPFS